jgi:trk system potassium uptake protein TrkH
MNIINWRAVLYINGFLLLALSGLMLIPPVCDLMFFQTHNVKGFYVGFLVCFVIGSSFVLGNDQARKMKLGMREAFLITSLVWVVLSAFSAIPYFFTIKNISMFDACFESVSALTTTGASMIKDVENTPPTILLWRSILQWLGGIGIIVIAMSFFPALRLGGMQLFRSEFSDRHEKILPKISQITASLLSFYIGFTVLCAVLYNIFGMNAFDAVCHAMCTISTGGLSTHSKGIKFFQSLPIEVITTIFMIIGGTTMILFIRLFSHERQSFLKDRQFKTFIKLIIAFSIIFTVWLWYKENFRLIYSLRIGYFNIVSAITTTGYTNTWNIIWSPFAHSLFLVLALIGGCTGSTTGGIKIFRLQVLWTIAGNHMRQLRRPHAVLIPKFQGYKITDSVTVSVCTLVALYIAVLFVMCIILSAMGLTFSHAFSCAACSLSNFAFSLDEVLKLANEGKIVFSTFAKCILMFGMVCGRLEILTVVILFMPSFWKN